MGLAPAKHEGNHIPYAEFMFNFDRVGRLWSDAGMKGEIKKLSLAVSFYKVTHFLGWAQAKSIPPISKI